jgi:cell division protein FtsX
MEYSELEKLTVIRLREEAKKLPDVKGVSAMKKEELLNLLVEKLGIEVPEKKTKKTTASPRGKASLKKKIEQLKMEREAARADRDSKKVTILRRRIHTLKRQIRKIA